MKRLQLTVSRAVHATPGEVFDLWIDPKSPGGPWFGAKRAIMDAVVDGLFYHSVEYQGREWAHYGRFVRLDRARLIEHTWMSEATRGIESRVTVTFEPQGDGTLVTLRHADLPDDDMGRQHEDGWKFVLGAVAERFAGSR